MLHLIVRPTPALALCRSTVVFDIVTAADPLPQSRLTAEEFRWEISPRGNARTNSIAVY
jgi:hypothetical protein